MHFPFSAPSLRHFSARIVDTSTRCDNRTRSSLRFACLSLALLLLGGSAARADEATTTAPMFPAEEPVQLEHYVVTASPFTRDQAELASATNVLSGQALMLRQQSSLGATLDTEPGIASTSFSPGASRPVIRGLGGDRVRILDNSVGTIDASVTSPDHAVSIEPLLAKRIEVVRGPATLLYGSNAVGGVVNVIDNRIPSELSPAPITGRFEGRLGTAADERTGVAMLEGAIGGNLSWHIDGLRRESEDVHIPAYADLEHPENHGALPNSAVSTTAYSAGLSHITSAGYIGASASRYATDYGTVAEPDVTIHLVQRRLDLTGEYARAFGIFSAARAKLGFADYEHTEFEGAQAGTIFKSKGYEGRLELLHEKLLHLNGAWGLQGSRTDFSALGEEAFMPPSRTRNYALFLFEELPLRPFAIQFGARSEQQKIETDTGDDRRDTILSASLGAVYSLNPTYALTLSLAHTERAPNAQELYANGPHLGTDAYEIGDPALSTEKSLGMDLGLRKRLGRLTGTLSLFANQFRGFIFERATGEQDPVHALPVYRYGQADARFYGAELEAIIHLHASAAHTLDLRLTTDTVRARELNAHENLPRITPRRAALALDYRGSIISANVGLQTVARARCLAPGETPTAGYGLLNASLTWHFTLAATTYELFVRGTNLTNQEARNHVSFLKNVAPMSGRDLTFGLRVAF